MVTDISDRCTEFMYEYDPNRPFSYMEFEKLCTATMHEYFEPLFEAELEDGSYGPVSVVEDEYTEEIHTMFHRMGIDKLDGCRNFIFVKKMSYIDSIVTYEAVNEEGKTCTRSGRFPLELLGTIYIYPKGLGIIC